MTDEQFDHAEYEQECLRLVREAFQDSDQSFQRWLRETARQFVSAELRGSYPDTELVVRLEDKRRGLPEHLFARDNPLEREFPYLLWGEAFKESVFPESAGSITSGRDLPDPIGERQVNPERAAADIWMWTMER